MARKHGTNDYSQYAAAVLNALSVTPSMTVREIQKVMLHHWSTLPPHSQPPTVPAAAKIIRYIRVKTNHDVITCDITQRPPVYSIAHAMPEGRAYIEQRQRKIRNDVFNVSKTVGDLLDTLGPDYSMSVIKANLDSSVVMLDIILGGATIPASTAVAATP